MKSIKVFGIVILIFGEMSEWSKVHDWKSYKVKSLPGFESPSLRLGQILRCWRHPTPPGPGGSNGKWLVGETQAICPFFVKNKGCLRKYEYFLRQPYFLEVYIELYDCQDIIEACDLEDLEDGLIDIAYCHLALGLHALLS